MPSLCLNTIVKNESSVILRMLESVVNIIDTYCICDTGSTDNTIELIQTFFNSRNIQGMIINHPFVNFEHNRNIALKACYGLSEYILLMDADMILNVGTFNKDELKDNHMYSILQGNSSFYYPNCRIIKNDNTSKYIGVTHEYLDVRPYQTHTIFDKTKIFITDIGDGGCKQDKVDRDIRLLKGDLEKNENNPRSLFYLANTYFDSGNLDEAIPYYLKRIEVGGWDQELWYSNYRLGEIYKRKGEIQTAVMYWMEGHSILPERLENVYKIINQYRVDGKQKLAYTYIRLIMDSYNKHKENVSLRNSYLFMENDVYTHLIDYEIVILSYYNGNKNVSVPVLSVLQCCSNQSIIQSVLSNLKFYINVYKPLYTRIYNSKIACNIEVDSQKHLINFTSSTCSIIRNPYRSGYILNVRLHNYTLTDDSYCIELPDTYNHDIKPTITQNHLHLLNEDFDISSSYITPISVNQSKKLIGVEDVRLFYSKEDNKIRYIGTSTHDTNDVNIVQGVFDYDMKKYSQPTNLTQSIKNTYCEKNWVYFSHNNKTRVLYSWAPFTVCDINENNELQVVYTQELPALFNHIRGSTCGVTYENEIWFVGHVVSHEGDNGRHRYYYDIIIVLDATTLQLIKSTPLFKYSEDRIQYTLGLIVDSDKVILSYSTMDANTVVSVYDKQLFDTTMIMYINGDK
jgi:tetratricopeptide (TPR) repeat protein